MMLMAADKLYVPSEGLLLVAAAGAVGWYLLIAIIWLVRLPKKPRTGPETTELGLETPAVVNLLTHRLIATRDAVPATLLDLAARGVVEIEDVGIGRYICRLKQRVPSLTRYESRLLDHLNTHAVDGIVPAPALTTGPQEQSRIWWRAFRKEIVAELQARGLSEKLWTAPINLVLGVLGGTIYLIYELAIGFNDTEEVRGSLLLDFDSIVCFAGIFALLGLIASTQQTDTPEGRAATSRWLGVRKALAANPSFDVTPPSGVVVWERHLAYGAAMGTAELAVRALPMGAESDTEAWTANTGTWRKVNISYPRLRPGWGRYPALALLVGTIGAFVGYRVFTGVLDLHWSTTGDPAWFTLARTVVGAIALIVIVRSLMEMVFAVPDLVARQVVTGEVLRTRKRWSPLPPNGDDDTGQRYFVAIDDGRSESIRAFRVSQKKYPSFFQGQQVRVTVTPLLGWVALIEQRNEPLRF